MGPIDVVELFKLCALLPVVVALGWFVLLQHKEIRAVEDRRVSDVKDVETKRNEDQKIIVDKLLALSERWNTTVMALNNSSDSNKEALKEIKEALRELKSAVERMRHD